MGVWGTPCEWIVLAVIQRVPPAEPVKTQIAVKLIVMLGSAPELGFVHIQKQGNEIVTQTGLGGNIPFCRDEVMWQQGYTGLRRCPWGEEVKLNKGLHKLRQVQWALLNILRKNSGVTHYPMCHEKYCCFTIRKECAGCMQQVATVNFATHI